jgi:hypothetical protein
MPLRMRLLLYWGDRTHGGKVHGKACRVARSARNFDRNMVLPLSSTRAFCAYGRRIECVNIVPRKLLNLHGEQVEETAPSIASFRSMYRGAKSRRDHQACVM